MTNGDKIRNMSDEEIAAQWANNRYCTNCPAEDVCEVPPRYCKEFIYNWLKQEAKDE